MAPELPMGHFPQHMKSLRKQNTHRKWESERMKSLGSGGGDQKNRGQRERTGRGLEGDYRSEGK